MEQLDSHWMDCHKVLYLCNFRKYVEKFQVSLNSAKNYLHFTWRPMYIFYHISLSTSYNDKYFRKKVVQKIRTDILCVIIFFNGAVYEIKLNNTAVLSRLQMKLRRVRIACWITEATNTHSKYVILIVFRLKQPLRERTSILCYAYITCLELSN